MRMGRIEKFFVNSRFRAASAARQADRALRIVKPCRGGRYLDIGCGTGAAAIHVARLHGMQTVGLDVGREQVEVAMHNALPEQKARFLTGDASRLPFRSESFDVVACSMVMHHVRNWKSVLAEVVRVVKPSSFIIYRDFAAANWAGTLLARVTGRHGILTEPFLRSLALRFGLRQISASTRLMHYDAVWQKT